MADFVYAFKLFSKSFAMNKGMLKPYFPYGIRVVCCKNCNETLKVKSLLDDCFVTADWWGNLKKIPYNTTEYELILRPVTYIQLTQPIRVNCKDIIIGKKLCQIVFKNIPAIYMTKDSGWLIEMIVRYFNTQTYCPFSKNIMSELCSVFYALHFDVFGYIEQSKARNICELSYDPYEFDHILL